MHSDKPGIWVTAVYFIFILLGVPWYWPEDHSILFLGMPLWVTVAVVVSLLTSLFTAFILLHYTWPGEDRDGAGS